MESIDIKAQVWNEKNVREWDDVAAEALKFKKEVQFGYLFGICVEKGSELPKFLPDGKTRNPGRKFKGRVVFQGNRVVNQSWEAAVFQDLGNSPATMDASRAADCYGCFPGNKTEIADAVQRGISVGFAFPLTGGPLGRLACESLLWNFFKRCMATRIVVRFGKNIVISVVRKRVLCLLASNGHRPIITLR